ncbi:MAG: hypothetical protein RLZZ385_2824 [Pseudomonadota bacterium]
MTPTKSLLGIFPNQWDSIEAALAEMKKAASAGRLIGVGSNGWI